MNVITFQVFLMLDEFGEELGAKTENVRPNDCFIEMMHVSAKWNEVMLLEIFSDVIKVFWESKSR